MFNFVWYDGMNTQLHYEVKLQGNKFTLLPILLHKHLLTHSIHHQQHAQCSCLISKQVETRQHCHLEERSSLLSAGASELRQCVTGQGEYQIYTPLLDRESTKYMHCYWTGRVPNICTVTGQGGYQIYAPLRDWDSTKYMHCYWTGRVLNICTVTGQGENQI
jgi:hypothetical protein